MRGCTLIGKDRDAGTMSTTQTSDPAAIRSAAAVLQHAQDTCTPCPPVRDLLPDGTTATGYAVQDVLTLAKINAGKRIVGRKVGLTSSAVQAQLGVDQPDFGVLFDDMACAQDQPVDSSLLLQPRIEAEIAFVLAEDLDHDDIDNISSRAAIAAVVPALEIVDSRIAGWDISFVDTVADNASSGLYVLGDNPTALGDRDLREVEMRMVDGAGTTVSTGTGAACLGDPINALTWLARTARDHGRPLRAGDLILSGAIGPMVPAAPGDSFTAHLRGIGSVRATFSS